MNARVLENKNALIHGAGGAIGGAIARAFARQGARVFLAGRTLAKLDAVAREVSAAGGMAETARIDALDEQAVNAHADASRPGTCFAPPPSARGSPSKPCWRKRRLRRC